MPLSWVFAENERIAMATTTLYMIHKSRSGGVLRKILGKWKGIIVCDGWRPYRKFRIQRC